MTDTLQAAKEAVELRKKATQGEWIQGWYVGGSQYLHREEDRRMGRGRIACMADFHTMGGHDSKFCAHAGNHYAAVAQLAIDLQAKLDAIGTPEWLAMAEAAIATADWNRSFYSASLEAIDAKNNYEAARAAYLAAKGDHE